MNNKYTQASIFLMFFALFSFLSINHSRASIPKKTIFKPPNGSFKKVFFFDKSRKLSSAPIKISVSKNFYSNLDHGFELWQSRGLAYVFRDSAGMIVNFGFFLQAKSDRGKYEKIIKTGTPEKDFTLYYAFNNLIHTGLQMIPLMTEKGEFINFIGLDKANNIIEGMNAPKDAPVYLNSFFNTPGHTRQGDPIHPGTEQYNETAETIFNREYGFEVLGNVRPWSHNLINGNNILISRSQKIKVDFKGPFTQNFYIFRSDKPDKTGILYWFSGNFGYSEKSITIPVEGGNYYGFCSDTPKKQTITVNWDNRP
jgi:hypothetical protein